MSAEECGRRFQLKDAFTEARKYEDPKAQDREFRIGLSAGEWVLDLELVGGFYEFYSWACPKHIRHQHMCWTVYQPHRHLELHGRGKSQQWHGCF